MNVTDEMIMAYVDDELDALAIATLERALREDPAVAAAVARAKSLRERVRLAYDPVLSEPVPARLAALASGRTRTSQGTGPGNVRAGSTRRIWRATQWAAMAASLVVGVLLAPWLQDATTPAALRTSAEGLVAVGALDRALTTRLISDAALDDDVEVGLSFRDNDGRYCRSFSLPAQALAGLACRGGGQWRVLATGEAIRANGEFRQAATALPPAVLAEIDARLAEESLDATGERAARDAGWE